jgi:hypothetical protein
MKIPFVEQRVEDQMRCLDCLFKNRTNIRIQIRTDKYSNLKSDEYSNVKVTVSPDTAYECNSTQVQLIILCPVPLRISHLIFVASHKGDADVEHEHHVDENLCCLPVPTAHAFQVASFNEEVGRASRTRSYRHLSPTQGNRRELVYRSDIGLHWTFQEKKCIYSLEFGLTLSASAAVKI